MTIQIKECLHCNDPFLAPVKEASDVCPRCCLETRIEFLEQQVFQLQEALEDGVTP